jgi:hypothetical protein
VALQQVFLRVLLSSPANIIPPTLHIILILKLLLSEGQVGERERERERERKKAMLLELMERIGQKSTFTLCFSSLRSELFQRSI